MSLPPELQAVIEQAYNDGSIFSENNRRPGYYTIRFQSHHFVRYWNGEQWLYAEGGRETGLPTWREGLNDGLTVTRLVQP